MKVKKLEVINIIVAVVGVIMILVSSICSENPNCSKFSILIKILGDLGVGVFPTGVIGLVIERAQRRGKEKEKSEKRKELLIRLNSAIHEYLNTVCNAAIKINSDLKQKKALDIIDLLIAGRVNDYNCNEEPEALKQLITRMQENFGSTNPLYIVADVFEKEEIEHFKMLIKVGNEYLSLAGEQDESIKKRNEFLSYVKVTCTKIPECSCFNDMISDGRNIFVPDNPEIVNKSLK